MAVGRPEIDPTWLEPSKESTVNGAAPVSAESTVSQVSVTPQPAPISVEVPTPPPVAHVPRDERAAQLPVVQPRLSGVARVAIGGTVVLVLGLGAFMASEAGLISLGIEQLWGISNRPSEAFRSAASALAGATRYHVDGELTATLTTPVRMPRLGTTSLVSGGAGVVAATSTDAGDATTVSGRLAQDVADGNSLTQSEWQFAAIGATRAQLGPPFTHDKPTRFDILATNDTLYLRDPEASTSWTSAPTTELEALGLTPLDWSALYQSLADAGTSGKRLRGKTINGERAKGYQATVPASAIASTVVPTAAPSGSVTVESWIGTRTHRPYLLTLTGTLGPLETTSTIVFGQFDGAESVLTPSADETTSGSLRQFLIDHTLLAADTPESRDALRKADLARIKEALATHATEARPFAYPKTDGVVALNSENSVTQALGRYLAPLPLDPAGKDRYYGYSSDGSTYRLTAVLEKTDDPTGTKEGDLTLYVVTP